MGFLTTVDLAMGSLNPAQIRAQLMAISEFSDRKLSSLVKGDPM